MARNGSHRRRWLIAAVMVFFVYLMAGFFVLPPIVRSQIEKQAGAALKRATTVEKVRFNPLTFALTVEDLRVVDHDGADLASWRLARVNFDPLSSLFRWEWHVGEVRLVEPRQRFLIAADGSLNIADLVNALDAPPPPSGEAKASIPRVGVGVLTIEGWAVDFSDQTRRTPFQTVVGPMTFELTGLTTRPNEKSPYALRGTTDTGETFGWSGTVAVTPFGSTGRVEFSGVSIPKHAPFAEDLHRAEVRSGTLSFATAYEVVFGDAPAMRLSETKLSVDGLALATPGAAEPAVAFTRFEVDMPSADLLARTAVIARAALNGLNVAVERRPDGTFDLADWLPRPSVPPDVGDAAPAGPDDPGPASSVRIERIELVDGRIQITDRTTPRPASLLLDQINVALTDAGTDLDQLTGVDAKLRWAGGGAFSAKGNVRARPFAASLDLEAENLALAPLEPYVERTADVRIVSGTLRARGHAQTSQDRDEPLALSWMGDVAVADLATTDGKLGAELVSWKELLLRDTRFALTPLTFSAAEIALTEPVATLAVAEDGTSNLAAAMRKESAPEGPAPDTAPEPEPPTPGATKAPRTSELVAQATKQPLPFQASIDAITITGGRLGIRDRSVGTGFSTDLRDFAGSIRGLSSENLARADVDLSGSLDGVAPLRITGSINPLAEDKFSDITALFGNIELSAFSPYAGRYLGQKIQKGKLRVELGYKVSKNMLAGENHVLLDQFYLGEKVASPDALKLPIGLALALLRDREGRIDLDMPVRGNLDDPDFKYGRVVWRAVGNLIAKAATSPFSMLGGLLGGRAQDTDLSYVDFASGSVELNEATTTKLELLAKALYERPGLRLEINAPASPDGDRGGLLEARLAALLDAERQQPASVSAAETPGSVVEPVPAPLGDEEITGRLFARLSPEEGSRVASITPADSMAESFDEPAESETRPGAVGRFFRSLFGGGKEVAPNAGTAAPGDSAAATPEDVANAPQELAPLTVEEMRVRILETIELSEAEFQELANARARLVRDRVLDGGQIEPERVFLTDTAGVPDGATAPTGGARIYFGLE